MTRPDLELELRDHYQSFDGGSPGAASRVAGVLDRAPTRRRWSVGRSVPTPALLAAGLGFVVVALLTAGLLPLWHGSVAGPAASSTANHGANGTPVATSTATPFPQPTPTPTIDPAVARVDDAGMTREGVIWALRDTTLDISTDNGRTWHESPLPPHTNGSDDSIENVTVADASHAWVAVNLTPATARAHPSTAVTTITIYRTVDGGATWQAPEARSFKGDFVVGLQFVDANVGFAIVEPSASGPSTIMRTLDGGATWAVTSSTASGDIQATDANTLWSHVGSVVAAPDGMIGPPLLRVSRDAGATWSDVPLPGVGAKVTVDLQVLGGWPGSVQFVSPAEGFLAVSQILAPQECEGLYYRTNDGGRTWSQVATLRLQLCPLEGPIFLDATHWLQDGKPIGGAHLLATSDGGQTWTPAGDARALYNAWTIDGQSWSKMDQIDPDSNIDHSYFALFRSWDGGVSWQPADFSAR
jgi:photosystem II stability/assembly factor-like uncharacterized protein